MFRTKTKHLIILAVATALAVPAIAFAAQQKFKLEHGTVQMDVPAEWQTAEGLMGAPLAILGPEGSGHRASMLVVPLGIGPDTFNPSELKDGAHSYKAGREAWLKQVQGRSLAYLPYKEVKLNNSGVAHSLGYRYQIGEDQFLAKTYYVTCKEKVFHLKTVMTPSQETAHAKTVDQMIASFTCE